MHTITNGILTVNVSPALGGRIDDVIDERTQKNWVWHPGGYTPPEGRELNLNASFDEHFSGGWEEMFPNDAATTVRGRLLPDHGEWWSQRWAVKDHSEHHITLEYSCLTVPIFVTKRITLSDRDPEFEVQYSLENLSSDAVPYTLKLHPAIRIESGDKILMPPCQLEPVDLGFSRFARRKERSPFPNVHGEQGEEVPVDTVLPADSGLREFLYALELGEGSCGVANARTKSELHIHFDRGHFPYVWLFQSYGGWEGRYVLMLEPCTTIPCDLEEAIRQNTCGILGANETALLPVRFEILETKAQ